MGAATAGTLVGNALSLLLPFVITSWYAAGPTTDAYFFALGAILLLNVTLSAAVEAGTTPQIAVLLRTSPDDVPSFVRRTQAVATTLCGLLTLLAITVVITVLLPASGFTPGQLHDVNVILLLLSPLPPLITWNAVNSGTFYAFGSFGLPTASVGMRTLVALISGFFLRQEIGIVAVPVGLVVGELGRLVVLELRARSLLGDRPGDGRRPSHSTSVPSQRQFWRSAGPQAVSTSLGALSPFVDKTIAIGLGAAAITTVELSQRMVYTPILFLLSGVGLVLGSRWAGHAAEQNWNDLRVEHLRARRVVLVVGGGVVLVAVPLVFVFRPLMSSALSLDDPSILAWTFTTAALGIPFALATQVCVRVLLAVRSTRWMPLVTVLGISLNLVLDLLLVRLLGVPGIGLATAAVNVLNWIAYGAIADRALRSRLGSVGAAEFPVDASGDLSREETSS
ncbi:lipid II flippase MurJ [Kineococcus sp. GCM10028916]|uniref:lipid II flippase MurJ n=1 Tax=Kineococcus sp. GCM10028916 TaxID=3273394 RepID=UPI00364184F3